jgi:hypothetical protein
MAVERELIEFLHDDTSDVERRIASLPDGAWVNIEPIVEDEDLDQLRDVTPHPVVRIFSAKGRPIPFGTIVAQSGALEVGLEHSRGARVIDELRDLGVSAPESWRLQQDHPRRGLVYAVPRHERAGVVLAEVPMRGRWSAVVARGR